MVLHSRQQRGLSTVQASWKAPAVEERELVLWAQRGVWRRTYSKEFLDYDRLVTFIARTGFKLLCALTPTLSQGERESLLPRGEG